VENPKKETKIDLYRQYDVIGSLLVMENQSFLDGKEVQSLLSNKRLSIRRMESMIRDVVQGKSVLSCIKFIQRFESNKRYVGLSKKQKDEHVWFFDNLHLVKKAVKVIAEAWLYCTIKGSDFADARHVVCFSKELEESFLLEAIPVAHKQEMATVAKARWHKMGQEVKEQFVKQYPNFSTQNWG